MPEGKSQVGTASAPGQAAPAETPLRLAVTGMHCAACVRRVERLLTRVDGVRDVTVNLALEQADLTVRMPVRDRLPALLDALQAGGYQGEVLTESHPQRTSPAIGRDGIALVACALLTLPLLLPMALRPLGVPWMPSPGWQLALAVPVQFGFGARFYRGAWRDLRSGSAGMDVLVVIGTSAAFLLSMVNLWLAGPADATPDLYFESSATVITLVLLGKWLEGHARRSTGAAIAALQALRPQRAHRVVGMQEEDCAIDQLLPGDLVRVRAGEQVPADGAVLAGESSLDVSLLTGESQPVSCGPGSRLLAGSLNGDGVLLVNTLAVGSATRLAQIIRLVEGAQAAKPRVQQQVDQVTAWFVPAVLVLSLLTGLGWWLWLGAATPAVLRAVAVLVIACPCALGLATPTALLVGTGMAARRGILLRDADVLEQALQIDTVAFDKTGTLTAGRPAITQMLPSPGLTRENLLRKAAALQQGSPHPLAQAVVQQAALAGQLPPVADGAHTLPGIGVQGTVDGDVLCLGSARLCQGIAIPADLQAAAGQAAQDGASVAWLVMPAQQSPGRPGRVLGLFCFADPVRPEAAATVQGLQQLGLHVMMLTGDGAGAAGKVARETGIQDVQSGLLPDEKLSIIRGRQTAGHRVAMVGDGINDAPALVQADLGIAMGGGSDIATHAAGITLLRPDLRLVAEALPLAQRLRRRIRLNLAGAFCYNLVGIPLAAAGVLSPDLAGLAMALSSVTVMSSALLLR